MKVHMDENRKIVIYGSGRYPKDFLYVFDSIKVSYYVDDHECDGIRSYHTLKNVDKNAIFIIICKYDEKNACRNLEAMGFKRGIDFVSAADLFYKLDFPIKDIAKEKNVYVYGTGDISHNFFHDFVEKNPDVRIVGCVDGDLKKKGKTFFRRPIHTPDEILDDSDNFFIIASTLYYHEIKEILMGYGKKEGDDFISSLAINHWASWMMRETIYDIPRLDYVCPKPFEDAALMHEGRLSVCVGAASIEWYNTPTFYADFDKVWHSNIMKILRLSVINGTYSFCSEKKCELKRDCGRRTIDTNEIHYSFGRTAEEISFIEKMGELPRNHIFCDSNYNIREKDYPNVLMFSYDRTCNLHCPSCRQEQYTANKQEQKMLENFTERLKKEVLPHVNRIKVAGDGEAFASRVYKNIIFNKDLAKRIPRIGILSNGTLLTPSNLDKLADNYDSIKIFISMDGCTKETAEKLRAGADFEKWKKNMSYLGKRREEGVIEFLAFNFVVQRANYLEMPEYVEMCLGFHADEIKFSQIRNTWYPEEEFEKMSMFDANGQMKEELAEVVKNEIFKRPEVHLFTWIDW